MESPLDSESPLSPLKDENEYEQELQLEPEQIIEEAKNEEDEIDDDDALAQVVDNLWEEYDDDQNGYLDIDETRNFIKNIMS